MNIEGRCHCGRINYDATIDPEKVIVCHCTDCQTISGASYRVNVPVLKECFRLNGEPKLYVKTADSGNRVVTAFCGECGAAIYSSRSESPAWFGLRVGAIKERGRLSPKRQGFCRSAMPWAMDISAVPKLPDRARS